MIVSDDGTAILCTDKNEDEIITEAVTFIISYIFQGRRRSIVYVAADSSSKKDDNVDDEVDINQVIATTIQSVFPTDAQVRDCIHQQCRKRVNNRNANEKIKTKKLKNGNQVVPKKKTRLIVIMKKKFSCKLYYLMLSIICIIFIAHQLYCFRSSNASSTRHSKSTTIESMKQELLSTVITVNR